MEQTMKTERRPAYGWTALAALAAAALCAVPHLSLAVPEVDPAEAEAAAASVLLAGIVLRTLLFVPLWMIVPSLWARAAHTAQPVILALLSLVAFGTGFLLTRSAPEALYDLALIAPAGILLYVMQRWKLSNFRIVLYGSVALLFGLFVRVSVPTLLSDGDAFLPMRDAVAAYRVLWNEAVADPTVMRALSGAGMPAEQLGETLTALKLNAEQYLIGILYYPAAIAALSNCLMSHLYNRRGGAELVKLKPFSEWRVEPAYVYGTLALTAVAYVLTFAGVGYGVALTQLAFAVWTLPMSLAGLCTLKRWLKGRPGVFALACVGTALLYTVLGQMLAIVGFMGFMQDRLKERMQGGGQK